MKVTKFILGLIGWCQIAFGTTLFSLLIAAALYYSYTNSVTRIISIAIVSLGLIAGSIWATIIWKKHGTIEWLSRIRRIS